MRIPNKFNGYSRDGVRIYNDPVTLSVAATEAAAASSAAAAATAATAAAAPTLAATTTALPGIMGGTGALGGAGSAGSVLSGAGGLSSGASTLASVPGAVGAETLAATSPEIASNLAAAGNTGIMGGTPGVVGATPMAGTPPVDLPVNAFPDFTNPAITGNAPTVTPSTTPVDMSNAGFSGNYTGAAESSKGLTAKGFDPNMLGQGGNYAGTYGEPGLYTTQGGTTFSGTPGAGDTMLTRPISSGINVTPEMTSKFATEKAVSGIDKIGEGFMKAMQFAEKNPMATTMAGYGIQSMMQPEPPEKKKYSGSDMSKFQASTPSTGIYNPVYQTSSNYAVGGQVEQMAAMNAVGANTGYPMANLQTPMYANPAMQRPEATNVLAPSADAGVTSYSGEPRFAQGGTASSKYLKELEAEQKRRQEEAEEAMYQARKVDVGIVPRSRTQQLNSPYAAALQELQGMYKKRGIPFAKPAKTSVDVMGDSLDEVPYAAGGGIMSHLGGYSDGGRLLKGPGDGMSDSIPAKIGAKQPARLADGEFVVPADVVSHLGNGSTEAGAKKLYAMMDNVRHARTGNKKQGKQINPNKFIPKA